MQGRNPMKGRHSVGVQRVSTGKTRGGQSEPASNKITTAAKAEISHGPSYVPDAKDTSLDAQNYIKSAPAPFKSKDSAPHLPAPSGPRGAKPGGESIANPRGVYAGKVGNIIGQSNPSGAATGYSKLPNQSKQIGGRMGFPPPARKAGSNLTRFKTHRNASFYGEI